MTSAPQNQTQSSLPGDAFPSPGLRARAYASDWLMLAGALAVSVALPEVIHEELAGLGRLFLVYPQQPEPSLVAATVATLGLHFALRGIWRMPFSHSPTFVIGAVAASYGLAAAGLKLAAIPIGFYHFWTGMLGAIAWYLFIARQRRTHLRPLFALVGPAVSSGRLLSLPVQCLTLTRPALHPQVTALAVTGPLAADGEWAAFVADAARRGMPVFHLDDLAERATGQVDLAALLAGNFGTLHPSPDWLALKRVLDIALALAVLPLAAALLAVLWLPLKLSAGGPVLRRRLCVGLAGRPFWLLSLATAPAAPDGGPPGRAAGLGGLVERWGLSRLPSLWNVLAGHLSWVGPRPLAAGEAHGMGGLSPFAAYREAVRPGVTGWALAYLGESATRGRLAEELARDVFYVRHTGLWLDCVVLVKAAGRLMRRRRGFGVA